MNSNKLRSIWDFIAKYYKVLIFIFVPPIIAIIPIAIQTLAAKCAFVVILMAVFWITNALPLSITSLFPILFFPALGIMKSEQVCPLYFKDINMLFFGGLCVATAIELTRLQERIALGVLLKFGSDPKWLMLGFMLVTAFLSLWISNTATTAMMLPVVEAVVLQLTQFEDKSDKDDERIGNEIEMVNSEDIPKMKPKLSKNGQKLTTGFLFCCAYSATIGGIGSLVGTAPNVLLKGYMDQYLPEAKLDFLSFMLFSLPVSILMLAITWVWLVIRWIPKKKSFNCCRRNKIGTSIDEKQKIASNGLHVVFKEKYAKLGPIRWEEKAVAFVFVTLILLWLTRDFHAAPGWDYFFIPKYISDTTPAIVAVFLLFILPRENIFKGKPYSHLIEWKTLQRIFPWDVFLLLGGSLAMADGFQTSGLSAWIGSILKSFANINKVALLAIIQVIAAFTTEFTSNTSIASIFLPIMNSLAKEANISPLYLMLPMILSVSLAFALPIATPNNAIIFSSGHIKMTDMISTGIVMNFIGLAMIFLASNTWLGLVFDLTVESKFSNLTTTTAPL